MSLLNAREVNGIIGDGFLCMHEYYRDSSRNKRLWATESGGTVFLHDCNGGTVPLETDELNTIDIMEITRRWIIASKGE